MLFLDEPTTGLDPEIREAMWEELARLRAEERLTILLTTHYLDEADQLADRVAIVDGGRHRRRGHARRAQAAGRGGACRATSLPSLNDVYLQHTRGSVAA